MAMISVPVLFPTFLARSVSMLGFQARCAAMILMLMLGRSEVASGQVANDRAARNAAIIAAGPGVPCPVAPPRKGQVYGVPDYTLKVIFDHRLPDAKKRELQPIKDLFDKAKLGPPKSRVAWFQNVIMPEPAERMVSGWEGLIHSVNPIKGGIVVELRITARQGGMVDTANIMERYSIINGKIRYLGFYEPNDMPRIMMGY